MAGTAKASMCLETTGSPRSVAKEAKFAERERQTEGKREMLGTTEKRVRKQLLQIFGGKEIERRYIQDAVSQIRKISEIFKDDLQRACCMEMMKSESSHKNPSPIILS